MFFFMLWAFTFPPAAIFDSAIYNLIAGLINFKHALTLFYDMRVIKFDEYREIVYIKIFRDLMDRATFQQLCGNSLVREIQKNRAYAYRHDVPNYLSIVVKGAFQVVKYDLQGQPIEYAQNHQSNNLQNGHPNNHGVKHNIISEGEFLDSPEFVLRTRDPNTRFQVDLVARENSVYLTWPREMLNEFLKLNPDVKNKLMGALGIDIARKLLTTS